MTQTWTILETGGVGFDVTGLRILTYRADSTLQGTQVFTLQDIRDLWESPFIPANDTIAGVRTSDIPALPDGWWLVVVDAVDDNDHIVGDTLRVSIR